MTAPADSLRVYVAAFSARRPLFERITLMVEENLRAVAQPLAPGCVVGSRTKSVASFAGKLLRKQGKYTDPLAEMTDLSGARVVCAFASHAEAVADALRQRFGPAIDTSRSLDQRSRLSTREFGYLSLHVIIELGPGRELPDGQREVLWTGLNPDMHGVKVEIQVRTELQDVWGKLTQEHVYKSAQPLPESIRRDVSRIAAEFESLDTDMERVFAQIADYRTHFGPFLSDEDLNAEHQRLAALREFDAANPAVPLSQAELALSRDAWSAAIAYVDDFTGKLGELTPELAAARGFALCQLHQGNPSAPDYAIGLRQLASATTRSPRLLMAWLRRAECELTPAAALDCYQRAYRIDPADPAALAGYVQGYIAATGDARFVDLLRPALHDAIDRCERQAALRLDLPWAYYRAGFFRLLLAEPGDDSRDTKKRNPRYETRLNAALHSFIRGIATSRHPSPIRETIEVVETLRAITPGRADVMIAARLLTLAHEARKGGADLAIRIQPLASPTPLPSLPGRVLIVAGSAKLTATENLANYERILRDALQNSSGLVISGGTTSGVPGLVGQIARESSGRIVAVGYVPERLNPTSTSARSTAYHELRPTTGTHFSPLEPLQAWIDLTASGVRPAEVTLLGLGGGTIAAFEYRLALILGARVCVFADSGREAEIMAQDPAWSSATWPVLRLELRTASAESLQAALFPAPPIQP